MKHITHPNLPQNPVGLVAVSSENSDILKAIRNLGIQILEVPPAFISTSVRFHADINIFHISGREVLTGCSSVNKNNYLDIMFANSLKEHEFNFETISIGDQYPDDVPLNACIVGQYLFCNKNTVSKTILNRCTELDIKPVFVNQGYTKCSICVINENAIITDDIGIAAAADKNAFDVLYISKGSVKLPGFEYGFIGGATGKLDKNKLAFTGDYRILNEAQVIEEFLNRYNITPICLTNGDLIDIGSIIPLMTK